MQCLTKFVHLTFLSLFLLELVFVSPARAQGDLCAVAKDLTVQGLEQVKSGSTNEVQDGLQLLKHANDVCISFGDAWYYRALFEKRLGQTARTNYSLSKAKFFGSEAMDQGLDPFALATGGPVETAEPGTLREKWALVVGISNFQDRHLPHLNFAGKDAMDFAAFLTDPNAGRFKADNVHTLAGDVSTKQLKMELNWLARSAQPDDLVVVFIGSHGTARNKDTADVNYIATSDTELEPEDNLFATSIPLVEISDIVRTRIKARRTVILLDTCHSGAAAATAEGRADSSASQAALDRIRQGYGRVILTSSQADELSYEGRPYANGYFTHFLIEALRKDNHSSIEQVYAEVRDGVSRAAQSVHGRQTPVLSHSDNGTQIVINAPAGK